MENRKCKLCLRNFANGKALGGHMRSHVMNLSKRSRTEQQIREETLSIPSEGEDEDKQKEGEISSSSATTTGGDGGDVSVVVQDRESETELSRDQHLRSTPRCRRSKRIRKSRICNIRMGVESSSPVSSISEASPEEDVAYCLMLLSKDEWKEEEEYDEKEVKKTKARGKYRCESCNKVFRSYQALGGHRASHKKIKLNNNSSQNNENEAGEIDANYHEEKIHECPICYRVFTSGQALGGHKRSHFTNSAAASVSVLDCSASTSTAMNVEKLGLSKTGANLMIDLNLPAPVDDDDTISDA